MNRFRKIAITCAVAVAPVVAVLGVAGASYADTPTDSAEAHFVSVWNEYGVPDATQTALLEKWESGQLWDSLGGGTPVSTRTVKTSGSVDEVSTYADGSISVTGLSDATSSSPSGIHTDADLRNCVTTESSHYDFTRHCIVHTNVVVLSMQYTVGFYAVQGGNSKILAVSHLTDDCYVGTCENQSARIVQKSQKGSSAAKAQGSLEWHAPVTGSETYDLNFSIKNGETKVSN